MTGSSSTWYAINARCSVSRNSAARFAGSEDGKQLLCRLDDGVRLLEVEPRAVVNATPGHRDREHAGRLRGTNIKRGIADIRSLARVGVHPPGAEEQRLGVGLVPPGLVTAHDRLEEVRKGHARERELDGRAPLRRDNAEAAALPVQAHEHVLDPEARFELVV